MTPGAPYEIRYDPRAAKELGKLDRTVARRVLRVVDALSMEPRPAGARALVGFSGLWRVRVGEYRVVYAVRDDELVVIALRVAPRSEVHRRL